MFLQQISRHQQEPRLLENPFRVVICVERIIMETRWSTTHNYKYGSVVSHSLPKPIKLTPQQLEEK